MIIDAYMDGSLPQLPGPVAKRVYDVTVHELDEPETALVGILEERIAKLA